MEVVGVNKATRSLKDVLTRVITKYPQAIEIMKVVEEIVIRETLSISKVFIVVKSKRK